MKFLPTFGVLLLTNWAIAQNLKPIKISKFSEEYSATIEENVLPVSSEGTDLNEFSNFLIKVVEIESQKLVIEAETYDFPDYLIDEQNQAIPNIVELPYGSQSVLIYEDFNFDSVKDFALMNGYMSCYGGPSYDVYLANGKEFKYSEGFSRLGNEYCGFFYVDQESKTISTMTKSGCCWHQYSEFKVVNNEPIPFKITEESMGLDTNFIEIIEYTYPNGKEKIDKKLYFPWENMNESILMSFELEKSNKLLVLYKNYDAINYALLLKDEEVEFFYPDAFYDEKNSKMNFGEFWYNTKNESLTFQNKDATYTVYENENSIGIKVKTNGKTYDLKGIKDSKLGTLNNLYTHPFVNLIID